jgi:hypothetical protein
LPPKHGLGYEGRMRYSNHCTATNKRGKPCGAWAIRGGNVCRVHGGMAPQVQRKARERLQASSDAVAHAIAESMKRHGVTAQTAGRGLPAPWGERMKKALEAMEGRYEQPAPATPRPPARRATRPSGPPVAATAPTPAPEAPVSRPGRGGEPRDGEKRPDAPRARFAPPTPPPPPALATYEDALADVAQANRRARAVQTRRGRRR